MNWEKQVYSSNVASVGYEEEGHLLYVTFKRGKRYVYEGVPEELAVELTKAASVGTMLNTDIKPYYPYRQG